MSRHYERGLWDRLGVSDSKCHEQGDIDKIVPSYIIKSVLLIPEGNDFHSNQIFLWRERFHNLKGERVNLKLEKISMLKTEQSSNIGLAE